MNKFIIFVITLYTVGFITAVLLAFYDAKKQRIFIFNDINRIVEYRNKHPRCRYCKYLETIKEQIPDVNSYDGFWDGRYLIKKYYLCELKDKDIKLNKSPFRGCLCHYFKLKDIENEG